MNENFDHFMEAWDEPGYDPGVDNDLNVESALGLIEDRPVSAWRRIEQWKEERQLRSLLREVYDE